MVFNSLDFFVFFIVVTFAYFLLPHKYRWAMLLAASCYFYMAFVPIYIVILFVTIIVDYLAGIWIENSQGGIRKAFLVGSVITNVGVLCIFKYYNFFVSNINDVILASGDYKLPLLKILLPIGLSFHTFQAMSYTIEVYRGNQKAERNFGIYSLYVMFYPQLVAGPIERPQNILHQFYEEHNFDWRRLYDGLGRMLWGLFKKVVIADRLSIMVGNVYNHPQGHSGFDFMLAAILFSIQVYCDFSGYSDIALGSAHIMGFRLMTNFNRPLFATSINDYWTRWHISLSTWFRDYLYVALGGNRAGRTRTYFNIFIIFLVSGFWHGANWTFVLWGLVHGLLLSWNHYWRSLAISQKLNIRFLKPVFWTLTFITICFTWVLFRVEDVQYLKPIYSGLLGLNGFEHLKLSWSFAEHLKASRLYELLAFSFLIIYLGKPSHLLLDHLRHWHQKTMWLPTQLKFTAIAVITFLFMMYCINMVGNYNPFLYFQF
jgi:D-alanyl-lipoteichoic acid acyltransferase DltB (MBOAT superfamily)